MYYTLASCNLPPTHLDLLSIQSQVINVRSDKDQILLDLFFSTIHAFPEHVARPVLICHKNAARGMTLKSDAPGFVKEAYEAISLPFTALYDADEKLQLAVGLSCKSIQTVFRTHPLKDGTEMFITWEVVCKVSYRTINVKSTDAKKLAQCEKELNEKELALFHDADKAHLGQNWSRKYTFSPSKDRLEELAKTPLALKGVKFIFDNPWVESTHKFLFFASGKFF